MKLLITKITKGIAYYHMLIALLSCRKYGYRQQPLSGNFFCKLQSAGKPLSGRYPDVTAGTKSVLNNDKSEQRYFSMLDPSTFITAKVSSEPIQKKADISGATPDAVKETLQNGDMFRVLAFRRSGTTTPAVYTFHNFKDYTVGVAGEPLMLDNSKEYTIIVYSFGTSSIPPNTIAKDTPLSTASIKYEAGKTDFLYQSQVLTFKDPMNTLNITLKHRITKVTTRIDVIGAGAVTSATGAAIGPHYATGDIALSGGFLTGTAGTSSTIPLSFGAVSVSGSTSSLQAPTVEIMSGEGAVAKGKFGVTMKIAGKDKVLTDVPFNITPGTKKNLVVSVNKCIAMISNKLRGFMCHDLGADTSADPFIPSSGIHGAKYKWGKKTPEATREQDFTTNQISWSGSYVTDLNAWKNDGTKGLQDPCPTGFRVPTDLETKDLVPIWGKNKFDTTGTTWNTANNNNSNFLAGVRIYPANSVGESGYIGSHWTGNAYDTDPSVGFYAAFVFTTQQNPDNTSTTPQERALHAAFEKAKGEVVITMDADLQDFPEEIPGLVEKLKEGNYDIVSGWKKKRFDNVMTKNIPSKLFNASARKVSGVFLHDFNCGLKAYKKQVVKTVDVYGDMHRYIPVLAAHAGFKNITEKEVKHQARPYGTSKFGANRFIRGFLDLITLWFVSRFGGRPIAFFVLQATQGLANYLHQQFPGEQIKVAIAYDVRHNSPEFGKLVTDVLTANGIKVLLFKEHRPTPELSFTVRDKKCNAGIVLTASHNPPEYNGYKVYWNDGAQGSSATEHTELISGKQADQDECSSMLCIENSLYQEKKKWVGRDLFEYCIHFHSWNNLYNCTKSSCKSRLYESRPGYGTNDPSGNFPTVESPNPEEPAALSMAMDLAKVTNADIVIGTDPDGDRLGIAVRNLEGEMQLLNGNQTNTFLTYYILDQWKNQGRCVGIVPFSAFGCEVTEHGSVHQGNEPFLKKEPLGQLIKVFENDPNAEISLASLKIKLHHFEEVQNPNNVKVITDNNGFALYFSRSVIPYPREESFQAEYFKHIGVYAFRKQALLNFARLQQKPLEIAEKIEWGEIDFSKFKGKKILVVNTASKCGFTPQYGDLEKIYQDYKDKLVIVGFPANNFGQQEPGTNEDIHSFCEANYGVSFPMAAKVSVKGEDIAPIFKFLTEKKLNGVKDTDIAWNFTKFLLDDKGKLINSFPSKVKPTDEAIVKYPEIIIKAIFFT
ncbi:hypothetical protein FQR65_LT14993 [Abscondita terminalis]|nr:hypothetical protein FQR65_LT14993 [Abscondita terminalis]